MLHCSNNNKALEQDFALETSWFDEVPKPAEAKAQGLLQAMTWWKELNIHNIIFETDRKSLVDILQNDSHDNSQLYSVISKYKNMFSYFHNSLVRFVKRPTNHVTHSLARESRFYACSQVCKRIPDYISDILLNEMK